MLLLFLDSVCAFPQNIFVIPPSMGNFVAVALVVLEIVDPSVLVAFVAVLLSFLPSYFLSLTDFPLQLLYFQIDLISLLVYWSNLIKFISSIHHFI